MPDEEAHPMRSDRLVHVVVGVQKGCQQADRRNKRQQLRDLLAQRHILLVRVHHIDH